MNKNRKFVIYGLIIVLVFFLVLSLITQNWKFFLWSLLPVFMGLMITFTVKTDKKSN